MKKNENVACFVDEQTMEMVYQTLKTPYKKGAVMKFENAFCDSPSVFRWKDEWYMLFIKIDKTTSTSGYETHLARSKDLLHWEYMYPILQKHLWLMPIMQVCRWFRLLRKGRMKQSLHELNVNKKMSQEKISETAELFTKLGLQ